ncbi:MAG: hypothetical protein Q8O21_00700, partial [bacterium]|nr:hypothetical protein [bacterium]
SNPPKHIILNLFLESISCSGFARTLLKGRAIGFPPVLVVCIFVVLPPRLEARGLYFVIISFFILLIFYNYWFCGDGEI